MAEEKGTDQPITRHPLFPAIIALWSGALGGLGSVVIGSSTIEGIVLALGIDKIIPMAAPPLGTTMRILLALAMTGIAAALGGLLARRIARPAASEDGILDSTGMGHTLDEATQAETVQPLRRRRALAIEPDATPFVEEAAPLPGQGEDSQILSVAEFDIDSFDEPLPDTPAARRFAETSFAETSFAGAPSIDEEENLPAWLDTELAWPDADAAPVATGVFRAPPGAQIFRMEPDGAAPGAEDKAETQESASPPASRLFETYSRELSLRKEEGEDDGLDKAAQPGFITLPRLPQSDWAPQDLADEEELSDGCDTLDDSRVDSIEFDARPPAARTGPVPEHSRERFDAADVHETHTVPPVTAAYSGTTLPDATLRESPLAQSEPTDPVHVAYAPFEVRSAAERIVDAELVSLSQVELLERLALAMQRRRQDARRAAEPSTTEAEVAPVAPPVCDSTGERDDASVSWSPGVPRAMRPVPLDPIASEPDRREPDRPGNAGHDGEVQGYLPARQLGGLTAIDAAPFPASPFSGVGDEESDDPVLQQGYSSLLNLSRTSPVRKPFLQFAEADAAGDPAGDAIAHATGAFAADRQDAGNQIARDHGAGAGTDRQPAFGRPVLLPDPVGAPPPEPQERAFDAPSGDPSATEKALRDALATLQRMNGAA